MCRQVALTLEKHYNSSYNVGHHFLYIRKNAKFYMDFALQMMSTSTNVKKRKLYKRVSERKK